AACGGEFATSDQLRWQRAQAIGVPGSEREHGTVHAGDTVERPGAPVVALGIRASGNSAGAKHQRDNSRNSHRPPPEYQLSNKATNSGRSAALTTPSAFMS